MPTPASGPKKVTQPTLQVLALFLTSRSTKDWFPLEISRTTGIRSSTITQILFRLEGWGWVESRWENADDALHDRRPRRRFYRLTGLGEGSARGLVESRLLRPPAWNLPGRSA